MTREDPENRKKGFCPMRRLTGAVSIPLFMIASLCCSPAEKTGPEVIPDVPEPDWAEMIQDAEAIRRRGHYIALREAMEIYKAVMAEATWKDAAAEEYVRTAIAFNLREKALGILDDTMLLELENLIESDESLAEYAPFVEILGYLPSRIKGTAGDNLPKSRSLEEQLLWIRQKGPPLDRALEKKSPSSDAIATLRIIFRKTFPFRFEDSVELDSLARLHPDSRFMEFERASAIPPDRERAEALLEADKEYHEARYLLGNLSLAEGRLITAEKYYKEALAGLSESPSVLISLAKIAFQMEELEPCLEYNEAALALVPFYRDALLGKALCLGYLGRNEEALEYLRKILGLGQHYIGEAHYWSAWNLNELDRLDEARWAIDKAKIFLIDHSDVSTLSGIIAYKQHQLDIAEKELLLSLRLESNDCDAGYYLGKIYADQKKWLESGIYFSGAAFCFERKEREAEKRVLEIEASDLVPERKDRLIKKKQAQILVVQATKATCQYNGAAGFHNAGQFHKALALAEQAAAHSAFAERAAELIKMIKDRLEICLHLR